MSGWAIGLAIAAAAAIVLGIVIGSSDVLRRGTHSTIEFLRPIPSVALIPLAVLVFGTSLRSTLLLVVYAAFWQVLIQVLYGVGDVDPVASDTAKSYGLGRVARVRYLVWPTALPYVMTGLRLGAAVALILADHRRARHRRRRPRRADRPRPVRRRDRPAVRAHLRGRHARRRHQRRHARDRAANAGLAHVGARRGARCEPA